MTTLYGIRNCDTVRKARTWLDAAGVVHAFHDYKAAGVDAGRLAAWADRLGWETLLNRGGTTFRRLPEHERADLDRDGALALMLAHPSAIRRPIIETAGALLVGFDPEEYRRALLPG